MLEQIKTLYNPTPGMAPDKIGPTVGQNSTSTPHAFESCVHSYSNQSARSLSLLQLSISST
jgi:hypothetical protein